jgi:hypothetical protein
MKGSVWAPSIDPTILTINKGNSGSFDECVNSQIFRYFLHSWFGQNHWEKFGFIL